MPTEGTTQAAEAVGGGVGTDAFIGGDPHRVATALGHVHRRDLVGESAVLGGVGGAFVGVPAVLGTGGVEKVIELALNDTEKAQFNESVNHVKQLVKQIDAL